MHRSRQSTSQQGKCVGESGIHVVGRGQCEGAASNVLKMNCVVGGVKLLVEGGAHERRSTPVGLVRLIEEEYTAQVVSLVTRTQRVEGMHQLEGRRQLLGLSTGDSPPLAPLLDFVHAQPTSSAQLAITINAPLAASCTLLSALRSAGSVYTMSRRHCRARGSCRAPLSLPSW